MVSLAYTELGTAQPKLVYYVIDGDEEEHENVGTLNEYDDEMREAVEIVNENDNVQITTDELLKMYENVAVTQISSTAFPHLRG